MNYGATKLGLTTAITTLALTLAVQPAVAQSAPIAGGVVGQVSQWKGVVTSVNQTTRAMVVKGPRGNLHAFTVPTSVPNLSTVKQGDTLTVNYVEAIALFVRKPTDPPIAGSASSVSVNPTGLPAVSNVQVQEVQANVTAINQATRMMTVKGPQGNSYQLQVDPSVTSFSSIKVGDQIVLRYTQALAVGITK